MVNSDTGQCKKGKNKEWKLQKSLQNLFMNLVG